MKRLRKKAVVLVLLVGANLLYSKVESSDLSGVNHHHHHPGHHNKPHSSPTYSYIPPTNKYLPPPQKYLPPSRVSSQNGGSSSSFQGNQFSEQNSFIGGIPDIDSDSNRFQGQNGVVNGHFSSGQENFGGHVSREELFGADRGDGGTFHSDHDSGDGRLVGGNVQDFGNNQFSSGQQNFHSDSSSGQAGVYQSGQYRPGKDDGQYHAGNQGQYKGDHSGDYHADSSGEYHPDESGKYSKDDSGRYKGPTEEHRSSGEFDFGYHVTDKKSGTDVSVHESEHGGGYRFLLPDGRYEVVTYILGKDGAYRPRIHYEQSRS